MGTRSWGGGNVKKRRGAGNRGGRGAAGGQKQNWTYTVKHTPKRFGRHGFHSIHKRSIDVINLSDIEERIASGKLKQVNGKYEFDFKGKVLGGGNLSQPVRITAEGFSKSAEEKIKKSGGEAVESRKAEAEVKK